MRHNIPHTVSLDKAMGQRSRLWEQSSPLGKSVFNLYEFTIIINISTDKALFTIGECFGFLFVS